MIDRLGRRQPCHCGSGRRHKNCCYADDAAKAAKTSAAKPIGATVVNSKLGVQGEPAFLTVTYMTADKVEVPKEGSPGQYDVVFYFRKPGVLLDEASISLGIDEHVGSSLLAIANPALQFNDPRFDGQETKMKLQVTTDQGTSAVAFGEPNKEGYLSDLRVTLSATSINDAGNQAKLLLMPAISAIAFASDIPLHISHVVVREKATSVVQRDFVVPFQPAAATVSPHGQPPEARVLFNRYRDGINSDDPSWRFLCFSSIVEQLWKKTKADNSNGVDLEHITIPKSDAELVTWLKSGFPKTYALDDVIWLNDVPPEARGMTSNDVIVKYVRPLRTAIAHSLLENGTLPSEQDDVKHRSEVGKWSVLLRCITRLHMQAMYGRVTSAGETEA